MSRRSRYGRAYRNKLGNGLIPPGDNAWCVHCDEEHEEHCKCSCHTKKRKPKCLCAVVELEGPWDSPIGCCMDCVCYCHRAEEKEHERTHAERKVLWKAELDRRDKEKFDREGVHNWEKEVLKYLMYDPSGLNIKYRQFVEVLSFQYPEAKKAAKTETGAIFIERMLRTPWGSSYIKEQSSPAHTKILSGADERQD